MLHINRRDVAEKQLRAAIDLDPRLAGPYASMGMLRMREDKDEEALQFLSKAVQSESQNHMAHYYYASLLQQLSEDRRAEDRKEQLELMRTHLKKSIELAPYFVEAYDLLAYVDLVTQSDLDDAEKKLGKAIGLAPGRESLRITLGQVMVANNKAVAARAFLTQLRSNTHDSMIRERAEELLNRIATYLESQAAMREYEERRKAAGLQAETASVDATTDTQPRLTRNGVPLPETGTETTLRVPERKVEGPQVEGFLTNIDCARGMTLQVRVGNGFVRLHTEDSSKVDFVSYAPNVKDLACGPVKPELKVVITYKRGNDPSVLGEPLVVEFRP
jgi:tetratricopeptide (TPR) repeat protein